MTAQIFFVLIVIVGIVLIVAWLLGNKGTEGTLDERVERIQSKQAEDMNPLAAKYQTRKVEENTKHTRALREQVIATIDLEKTPEEKRREEEVKIAVHRNVLSITEEATNQKLGPGTYESLKLQEGVAQIELLKAQGLKDIEWEYLEREHNLQLRGAILLAIKRQKELEGLMDLFESLARKIHQIETGDDPQAVKDRLLPRLNRNLEIVSQAMDGENRLLQEVDGEES